MKAWVVIITGCLLSGCLVMHNKNEIVRKDEKKLSVEFESEQAAEIFKKEVDKQISRNDWSQEEQLVIPFIVAANNQKKISYNARYNDEIRVCDANKDSQISLREAQIYAGVCIASPEAVKASSAEKQENTEIVK